MSATVELVDQMCELTAQSLQLMDTVEHFQLLKLLGEGSYGKVMLAVHRKRGTPMALKFFPRRCTSLGSFLKEYSIALTCSHSSLSCALGIVYCTPSHYVFAQQVGLYGDLYDIIIPEVGVEQDVCQRVTAQLSAALTHLHTLGFIHRDVKPENVFVCDATCRSVKLGDFGMVKPRGSRVPEVWYSSAYCTPEAEVARGNQDSWSSWSEEGGAGEGARRRGERVWVSVEPGVDSWALGVLVYALLTGTQPWAETASDCPAFLRYQRWFHACAAGGAEDPMGAGPRAPQFDCFTQLACSLFLALLDPRPQQRGRPEDALPFLGADWMKEGEEERKAAAMRKVKEGRARP